jgi:hypothetical protein
MASLRSAGIAPLYVVVEGTENDFGCAWSFFGTLDDDGRNPRGLRAVTAAVLPGIGVPVSGAFLG